MQKKNSQMERIIAFAKKRFGTVPDHPWQKVPERTVLRHKDSGSWYAIFQIISPSVLSLERTDKVTILNVHTQDPAQQSMLLGQDGIFPAYHMNKANWVSILMDSCISDETAFALLEDSFFSTASSGEIHAFRAPRAFLVPARVSLADPRHFFDSQNEIIWTQSSPSFRKGDTVCIYAGVPISCILYECLILATDLPAGAAIEKEFPHKKVMRMKLLRRFRDGDYPKKLLAEQYGITNIRGPRYLPDSLMEDMENRFPSVIR